MSLEEFKKKFDFKVGVVIAVAGCCFVIFSYMFTKDYPMIRMTGYMIALIGLITMGNRLYERIKQRREEKLSRI